MRGRTNSACTPRFSCTDVPANAKTLTASRSARASGRMGADRGAKGTPNRAQHPPVFLVRIVRRCSAFASGIGPALRTRARARRRHAHMGRPRRATSRPRRRRGGGVSRPFLLRHLGSGARRPAQTAARPYRSAGPRWWHPRSCSGSRAATQPQRGHLRSQWPVGEGGQPRPGAASPSSAPLAVVT